MPNEHFQVSVRDRLLLPLFPEGATCLHRAGTGRVCGEALDRRGHHARKCCVGGALLARHNRLRDWSASAWTNAFTVPTSTEQHVPAWDLQVLDEDTGEVRVEKAILDVATSDPTTGAPLWFDITVTCAHSDNAELLRSRVKRDGRAASDAAANKRRRYAAAGASLVPVAFEDGGRPSEDAVALIRRCGAAQEGDEGDGCSTARLWQQVSTILQLGNAEMVLTAKGN